MGPDFSGLFANIGQNSSVHIEDVAVDKVGGVGGQKDRRTHQVLRVPPAARRGLGHDELVEGVAASVRLALPKGAVWGVAI